MRLQWNPGEPQSKCSAMGLRSSRAGSNRGTRTRVFRSEAFAVIVQPHMTSAPLLASLVLAAVFTAHAADSPPKDPAALGPFGIGSCHTNNRSVRDAERWVPQMEAIGLHYFRSG